MYNRIVLVGNLTRDIELKFLSDNLAVAKTGIAVNRKSKSGDEVMFVDITSFGRTAEVMNQYLRKGSKVLVEGRLVLDQWTDQDGQKRSKHGVTIDNMQMLDSRGDNGANRNSGDGDNQNHTPQQNNYSDVSNSSYTPQMNRNYSPPQNNYGSSGYGQQNHNNGNNNYGQPQQQMQHPPVGNSTNSYQQNSNNSGTTAKSNNIPEIDIDDQVPF